MKKPNSCPFCGGSAEVSRTTRSMIIPEYRISCTNCGATVMNYQEYLKKDYFDTEDEAVKAWNRRV